MERPLFREGPRIFVGQVYAAVRQFVFIDGNSRREAALAQATRLFWLEGYEATTIAHLTNEMGIGSPNLYAAFGSKEALFTEALRYSNDTYEALVWSRFRFAATAHEAVLSYLMDSAAAPTGSLADNPFGCMVTLSSIGGEGRSELGNLVRSARSVTLESGETLEQSGVGGRASRRDGHSRARFIRTV